LAADTSTPISLGRLENSLSILALTPLGGSVVILTHLCRIEIGNLGCGLVESQSLKLLSISFLFI
jgi:hypothetical protein